MKNGLDTDSSLLQMTRHDVDAYLDSYFAGRIRSATTLSPQYGRLWNVLFNLYSAGGKRLRPYMVVLAYQCFGGKDRAYIMPVAASWEMLHLCMLVHDDIIDNDLVRYGIENVAGTYRDIYRQSLAATSRQQHHAVAAALLAGDLALSAAHELIINSSLPDAMKLAAQGHLTTATFAVAGGELLDTEAALYPVMDSDPELTALLKTASYSFIGPLTTGAALAGASLAGIRDMERLGSALGSAYQLVDDLIGVFGDPAVTGKSADGDISEGKRTYLLQQAFKLSSPADNRVLQKLVGKPDLTAAEAATVRQIISRSGAKQHTETAVASYAALAAKIVDGHEIPGHCSMLMHQLIRTTTERTF